METGIFRYKGVSFPYCPKSVGIRRERKLARFFSPMSGSVVQDLGNAPTVISGTGEFAGSRAQDQIAAIAALFEAGGTGLLQLPGRKAANAWFAAFETEETAGFPLVRYRFSFLEEAIPTQ